MSKFVAHCTTEVSVKQNCDLPNCTKTSFQLLAYEKELSHTVLPTFEDDVKFYLLVPHNTKQEIAEKLIHELVAPQLKQSWH